MSSSTSTPFLALFGATGGCCRAVLRHSLDAGLRVNVLARTPSKLTSEFPSTKFPNLTIIQGDIRDFEAVSKTLTIIEGASTKLVDIVVSGVGMLAFDKTQQTVCEDGMKCILSSIAKIRSQGATAPGPKIVAISTKGCSTERREVPLLMVPVYAAFVRIPIIDKRKMERDILNSGLSWCVVRPSHLVDGEAKGLNEVRVGWDVVAKDGKTEVIREAMGYTIRREDVGLWIFQELVSAGGKQDWEQKIVGLTY